MIEMRAGVLFIRLEDVEPMNEYFKIIQTTIQEMNLNARICTNITQPS